jgi:anaerobic magnesium-protoporphyrin IX monomethyl ester cyclase
VVKEKKKTNKKNFKVAICYPPIDTKKGVPLLSQNRQFQYFNSPTYVYPMVPAYAATMAKERGYDVVWLDGIAEKMCFKDWFELLKKEKPDLLLIETKTPVVKTHWKIINEIKDTLPETIIVLVGDHVTFLPIESLEKCSVDYVITGGDYDFVLLDLLNCVSSDFGKKKDLPGGIFGRKGDTKVKLGEFSKEIDKYWTSGPLELKHNLDDLPFIDRDLTKWKLYAYENGNYKYRPGTYTYSARDCWWGKCTFCIWDQVLYPQGAYRRFSPKR